MLDTLSEASSAHLDRVVRSGHRRALSMLALREGLLGASIATLGLAALFALGTNHFPPLLFSVFLLAGLGVGIYRWRQARPNPYQVAQWLDHQWSTDDQVSTAYYFLKHRPQAGPFALRQRHLAGKLAAAGDLTAALPFRMPRSGYAFVALTLLAASFFALRYFKQPQLSLEPPLLSILSPVPLDNNDTRALEEPEKPPAESIGKAASQGDQTETPEQASRSKSEQVAQAGEQQEIPFPEVEGLSLDGGQPQTYGDEIPFEALASPMTESATPGNHDQQNGGTDASLDSQTGNQNSPEQNWDQKSDSLLDRLKEAFENMLSSMNLDRPAMQQTSTPPSGQGQQGSDSPQKDSGQNAEASSEASAENPGDLQMEGDLSQTSSQQSGPAQGNDSGTPSSGQGQKASGAGSEDGSKELRQAQHLEAMGKLEELYSRRAENLKGDFTVETESADQRARTPYQPTPAGHRDRGGAVSRDEIPLAYQSYIKNYFMKLREEPQK